MDIKDLFESYNKDIYRYAYSITLNEDEAKDTVSEVFSKLINKDLNQVENYKAYLLTTARNVVYKKYAKESKLTNLDETQEFEDIDTKSSEATAIDSYLIDVIKIQLNKLDPSSREVILLKVWEDYKFSEIAEIINQKESTVKLRYYRGLEKLKENINSSTKLKSVTLPLIIIGITKALSGFNYPEIPLVIGTKTGITMFKILLGTLVIGVVGIASIFIAVNFLNKNTINPEPVVSFPISVPEEVEIISNEQIEYTLEIKMDRDSNRDNQYYRSLIYKNSNTEKEIYRWLQYSEFGIGGSNPCAEIKYNEDRSFFAVCQMSAEVLSNQQIPLVFNQKGELVFDFANDESFPKDKLTSKKFGETFYAGKLLKEFSWVDRTNLKLTFLNQETNANYDSIHNIDGALEALKLHDWSDFTKPQLWNSGTIISNICKSGDFKILKYESIKAVDPSLVDSTQFSKEPLIGKDVTYFNLLVKGSCTPDGRNKLSEIPLNAFVIMIKENEQWKVEGTLNFYFFRN